MLPGLRICRAHGERNRNPGRHLLREASSCLRGCISVSTTRSVEWLRCPTTSCSCVDVDETLLNNDAVRDDLKRRLGRDGRRRGEAALLRASSRTCGPSSATPDYLGALQRTWLERHAATPTCFWPSRCYLLHCTPSASASIPGALDTIAALRRQAPVVILSDGDAVHQPNKDRALRHPLEAGRRRRADLRPQGADARRHRAAVSGAALRDGGRQSCGILTAIKAGLAGAARPRSSSGRATTRSTRRSWPRTPPADHDRRPNRANCESGRVARTAVTGSDSGSRA